MSADDGLTWLHEAMHERQARNAEVLARFEAMSTGEQGAATLVRYACDAADGCHLLTVWQDRGGRSWYTPACAVPQDAPAKAGLVDDVLDDGQPMDGVGLALNCQHLRDAMLSSAELVADLADATPGQPKRVVVSTRQTVD